MNFPSEFFGLKKQENKNKGHIPFSQTINIYFWIDNKIMARQDNRDSLFY